MLRPRKATVGPLALQASFDIRDFSVIAELYKQIPEDTEILLTHSPPHRVLDKTRKGKHAGCELLAARLATLDYCRLHVFGHIHDAHGAQLIEKGESKEAIIAVNAALRSFGQAIVVDLKN
jgi:Icc-related predicted phosphoesterase